MIKLHYLGWRPVLFFSAIMPSIDSGKGLAALVKDLHLPKNLETFINEVALSECPYIFILMNALVFILLLLMKNGVLQINDRAFRLRLGRSWFLPLLFGFLDEWFISGLLIFMGGLTLEHIAWPENLLQKDVFLANLKKKVPQA